MFEFFLDEYCFKYKATCIRYIVSLGWSAMIFFFSIYCIVSTYRIRRAFTYELAPLITSALQSFLHAIQFSMANDNHLVLFINYLQVVTFAFLGQSFMNLYYRLTLIDYESFKTFYQKIILIPIVFYSAMLIIIAILNGLSDSENCSMQVYYIILAFFLVTLVLVPMLSQPNQPQLLELQFIMGTYYLILLKSLRRAKFLKKKQVQMRKQSKSNVYSSMAYSSFLAASSAKEVNLIVEKKQQIKIVCYGIAFTCIFYIFFVIYALLKQKTILCDYAESPDEYISLRKNITIGLIFLIEITPCLYIPYVFYYIPVAKGVVDQKHESHLIQDIKIDEINVSLQPQDPFQSVLMTDDLFLQRAQIQKNSDKLQ